jgi:hypothetical protein
MGGIIDGSNLKIPLSEEKLGISSPNPSPRKGERSKD